MSVLSLLILSTCASAQCAVSRVSYSYYPSYGYSYSYSLPGWSTVLYNGYYVRRWFPAGYYAWDSGLNTWQLQGYGATYGYANSLLAIEVPPPSSVEIQLLTPPSVVINAPQTPSAPVTQITNNTGPSASDIQNLTSALRDISNKLDSFDSRLKLVEAKVAGK
jgi:hypothetical protein